VFEECDIVCLAPGFWDESWLDVHRYMRLLAENNRVLVVERPITPVSFLTPGQRKHALPQLRYAISRQIRQPYRNLFIVAPPLVLPIRYEDPILYINQFIRLKWLKSLLQRLAFNNPILWTYDPDSAPLVGQLDEQFSLYMVTDDYATNPLSLNRAQQVRKWDNQLAKRVDLVITSESGLAQNKLSYNPNTVYVPHGVEYDIFSRTLYQDLPILTDIADLEAPIIGFVGRVNQRIDISLIEAITAHWTLLLVGEIGEDAVASTITKIPNVISVGHRSVTDLPSYLKAMSACIIPYVLTIHTQHMHPLKALEYLAAGRPVISTSLPSLAVHRDFVSFADTPESFVNAIALAIQSDSAEKRIERSRYTASMKWEDRLKTIYSLYENTLRQK